MLAVGLLFAVLAQSAHEVPSVEGIDVRQSVEYYRIEGRNAQALAQQMRELGPIDPLTGNRVFGYASTHIAWRYRYREENGECRLGDIAVELDTRIQLPGWQPSEGAGRIVAKWSGFLLRLAEHEYGHRDLGVEAAKAVRDALERMPAWPCDSIQARADAVGGEIIEGLRAAHRDYDRETRHGQLQGATWP